MSKTLFTPRAIYDLQEQRELRFSSWAEFAAFWQGVNDADRESAIAYVNNGGTINMVRDSETGEVKLPGGDPLEGSLALWYDTRDIPLEEGRYVAFFDGQSVDSSQRTTSDHFLIANSVRHLCTQGLRKVIVSNGTDSLAETAFATDAVMSGVAEKASVVFVASMYPRGHQQYEGYDYLRAAAVAVQDSKTPRLGALICCGQVDHGHGRQVLLFAGSDAYKRTSGEGAEVDNLTPFAAVRNIGNRPKDRDLFGAVATVMTSRGRLYLDAQGDWRPVFLTNLAQNDVGPLVSSVRLLYPNQLQSVEDVRDIFSDRTKKGFVLVGKGAGNLREDIAQLVATTAKEKGKLFVITSQAPGGAKPTYGVVGQLRNHSNIAFTHLRPEQAEIWLAMILAMQNDARFGEEFQAAFLQAIVPLDHSLRPVRLEGNRLVIPTFVMPSGKDDSSPNGHETDKKNGTGGNSGGHGGPAAGGGSNVVNFPQGGNSGQVPPAAPTGTDAASSANISEPPRALGGFFGRMGGKPSAMGPNGLPPLGMKGPGGPFGFGMRHFAGGTPRLR